jgi:excisionase family DNA binding protein
MTLLSANPTEPSPFLTPQDVSELLRVSVYTVRRWIKEGNLPAYKVGRGWRIPQSDVGAWLERNQTHMAPEA